MSGPTRRAVKWKDDAARSDFGRWLTARVGERTYDWLADEMAARDHVHGADYYRAMAGGSKPPGRAIRRALLEFFGEADTPVVEAEPSALADAVMVLVEELRVERAERQRLEQGRSAVLRAYLAGQVPAELLDALAPPPHGDAQR